MWKTNKKLLRKLHHLDLDSNWLRRLEKKQTDCRNVALVVVDSDWLSCVENQQEDVKGTSHFSVVCFLAFILGFHATPVREANVISSNNVQP